MAHQISCVPGSSSFNRAGFELYDVHFSYLKGIFFATDNVSLFNAAWVFSTLPSCVRVLLPFKTRTKHDTRANINNTCVAKRQNIQTACSVHCLLCGRVSTSYFQPQASRNFVIFWVLYYFRSLGNEKIHINCETFEETHGKKARMFATNSHCTRSSTVSYFCELN